jgi:hypothetical protein
MIHVGRNRARASTFRHSPSQQRPSRLDAGDAEDLAARFGLESDDVADDHAGLVPLHLAPEHSSDRAVGRCDAVHRAVPLEDRT